MDKLNIDVNELWSKATDIVEIDGTPIPREFEESYKKLKETEKEIESRVVNINGVNINREYEKAANLIFELQALTENKEESVQKEEEPKVVDEDTKVLVTPAPEPTQLLNYKETSEEKTETYPNPFAAEINENATPINNNALIDEPTETFEFVFPENDPLYEPLKK